MPVATLDIKIKKEKTENLGTFSINFQDPADSYTQYSVDWGWPDGDSQWHISETDNGLYRRWYEVCPLYNDEEEVKILQRMAYNEIMDRFGLSNLKDEITIAKLANLSPQKLANIGKQLHPDDYSPPISDCLGSHNSASLYV